MSDEILTVVEVANYLKLTERTVYKLAQNGEIPSFKVGKFWRFKKTDIELWIEDNQRKSNVEK